MRKAISIFLIGLLTVGLLTGCKDKDTTQSIEGEVPTATEELSTAETEEVNEPVEVARPEEDILQDVTDAYIARMTLEQKVAQLFVVTPENLVSTDVVTAAGDATYSGLSQYPVGGIIYLGQNLISTEQTKQMLSNTQEFSKEITGLPIFLAVDEEGGTVSRIGGTSGFGISNVGNMRDIGATGDSDKAYQVGTTIGTYLTDLGFNVDFAPDADVLTNSENTVVYYRSFGSDPDVVTKMVLRELEGFKETGLLGCVKHFPGHGATSGDTHAGYSYTNKTEAELWESELLPFQAAVDADVPFVMVSHISLPNVTGDNTPSTLSYTVTTGILRDEMGYDGIVITDALNMGAITESYGLSTACVKAVQAGSDMLLLSSGLSDGYQGVLAAVNSGEISEERIDESMQRIVKQKLQILDDDSYEAMIDQYGIARTEMK